MMRSVIGGMRLARYRFVKGTVQKVALRMLATAVAVAALFVGFGIIRSEAGQTLLEIKPTNSIALSNKPEAPLGFADDIIVMLNDAAIKQQGDLVIVSKKRLWPKNHEPSDLINIKDYKTTTAYGLKDNAMRADRTAMTALDLMLLDAGTDGIKNIVIMSSYRGYEKQRILFDARVDELLSQAGSRQKAEEIANQSIARPGESEHHTGLAFDLSVTGIAMQQFGDTAQGQWIRKNCASYGFVLRYQPHKAALTGITSEPWHIRYVGIEAAQKMAEKNWCLEEYVMNNP